MIVRFGRKCPKGFLPVFSVNTEEEAYDLLLMSCPRNLNGEFVAPELAEEQTLPNLYSFGDRLRKNYQHMLEKKLVSDIAENGIQAPIVMREGAIIDGRSRVRAGQKKRKKQK